MVLTGAGLLAHARYTKPFFNAEFAIAPGATWDRIKSNGTTRGRAGAEATTLFMMDPALHHTGYSSVLGFRLYAQDQSASTPEWVTVRAVKYDRDGEHPDTTTNGVMKEVRFPISGVGTGVESREWLVTAGFPEALSDTTHGVSLALERAPAWPHDGLSVHAQLNLPSDPLRPRLPSPFDEQVWAFERPEGGAAAEPLGGRRLDTLLMTTEWVLDPVLQTFVVADLYGQGREELYGPESLHPVASRGDELGFFLQGLDDSQQSTAMLLISDQLAPTPLPVPGFAGNSFCCLSLHGPFPCILQFAFAGGHHGQVKFPRIPFRAFPEEMREFWVQAVVGEHSTGAIRMTDAVGVRGL
ncbi:MAG: hypothetical protein AAF628_36260 [Planctomycetota bacterium]